MVTPTKTCGAALSGLAPATSLVEGWAAIGRLPTGSVNQKIVA
jgi:hypothetical protein